MAIRSTTNEWAVPSGSVKVMLLISSAMVIGDLVTPAGGGVLSTSCNELPVNCSVTSSDVTMTSVFDDTLLLNAPSPSRSLSSLTDDPPLPPGKLRNAALFTLVSDVGLHPALLMISLSREIANRPLRSASA